jgi:NADH-quinone oxidoreductase subunit D
VVGATIAAGAAAMSATATAAVSAAHRPVARLPAPEPPGTMTRMTSQHLTERIAGTGTGLETTDMVLNIGPQHPATHGVLRLRLVLDGERIVSADPIIGYMHRGAEKLFEVRDYRQIIVLANRHDWLSAFASELGVVLAVERMLGMEVPERATWARTLLAELNRILNHLMFLGSYPLELGAITPIFYAFREREEIQAVMEEISGGRMHFMFNRVGGLKEELPLGWTDRVRAAIAKVRSRMSDIDRLITGNEIFRARTKGVGVLTPEQIAAYGVSGPIARASGVDFDLRRDDPYLAYGEPEVREKLTVVTGKGGDCLARFEVLLAQAYNSLDIAQACADKLDTLPTGPINQRLPKILKVPEGHTYAWTENPLGINGYFLVSHGDKTPWRLKLRSASFNNIQVLSEVLPGHLVSDMVAILGSMFFVVGDIDK